MGLRDRIQLRVNVKLTLTADDWDLYDGVGRNSTACSINELVEQAINDAPDRNAAEGRAFNALYTFKEFGAIDSEPLRVLERILGVAFS